MTGRCRNRHYATIVAMSWDAKDVGNAFAVIAIISRFLTAAGVLTASIVLGINLAATERFVKEQGKPKMVSSEVEDM